MSADLCDLCFKFAMDELETQKAEQFALHLEHCHGCQAEVQEIRELRHVVEQSFLQSQTPHVFNMRLLNKYRFAWVGLAAVLIFSISSVLSQNTAFASRIHETAHDLHDGLTHPRTYFRLEAERIADTRFLVFPLLHHRIKTGAETKPKFPLDL